MRCDVHESEWAYRGFLKLRRYRLTHSSFRGGDCGEIVRERIEAPNAVSVLLYDPDAHAVVLVEQFRIGVMDAGEGAWTAETVGGYREPGEAPEAVARRETLEEAGLVIDDLVSIIEFAVSPGISSERIQLYCGRVDATLAEGVHGLTDEGEETRVRRFCADAAYRDMMSGTLTASTSTLIALQWLQLQHKTLRARWRVRP